MGAWIEMLKSSQRVGLSLVAPYMGAWIEIVKGLEEQIKALVAPYMGAWIEISSKSTLFRHFFCRTLHGCVD